MRTLTKALVICLYRLLMEGSGGAEYIVLTHVPVEAGENSSVVLSCYSTSDPINGVMFWLLNNQQYWVNVGDNPCRAIGLPLNRTDVYTINCYDIHNISLTIIQVDRLQHGDTWQCRIGFQDSNVITMHVKVPVVTLDLTFTGKDFVAENETSRFQCKSSFSRPKAEIDWFLNNRTPAFQDDERIISYINESVVNKTVGDRTANILTSTVSELALKVHRSMNNQQIYCLTKDTSGRVLRSTLKTLYISYPPDGPPYIRGSGHNATYSIINKFQGNLTCIVTGGNPLPNLNWACFENGTQTLMRSNRTSACEFTWTASMDNNKMKCTCQSIYLAGHSSASVSINVLYPPSLPEFYIQLKHGSWRKVSYEIDMKENNPLTMKCSAQSNPVATFSWTGPLSSYKEKLHLNVTNNRSEGSYTCSATNVMTQTNGTSLEGMKNNSIRLNVLYPPSDIKFTIWTSYTSNVCVSKIVNIFENDSFILTCYAHGKPEPKYSWTGQVTVTSDVLNFTSINRNKNGSYTCTAKNTIHESSGDIHNGQENESIYLNIQYPPGNVSVELQYLDTLYNIDKSLEVIEYDSFNLTCFGSSKPKANYSWSGKKSSSSYIVQLARVNRSMNGIYTCHAVNEMQMLNGAVTKGDNDVSIHLSVLFPADVSVLSNSSINEGADFRISCPVIPGNTSYLNVSWTEAKETRHWSGTELVIKNVTREDSTTYTCTVISTMLPTFGNPVSKEKRKNFYLYVFYASEMTEFFVAGHKENNLVITNQGDNATFVCSVDSNPSSAIGLQFKDKYLVSNSNTWNLTHYIGSLSCSNAGIYYCYSSNNISYGKRSWKQLTLIVKCPPLPENDLKIVNVTTLKYVPAILNFKAIEYLDTQTTLFTWQREINASQWVTVKNDTPEVKISTINLQTNMTIVNVTGYYSGNYRVVYNNSVGGNTQLFQLSVADLPDPPTYFYYLKESLTSTKVTVVWTKGFGGGLRQTFVLNISQTSQPNKYDYINETESETILHTITGLSSGTQYQITLWATNSLGKSLPQTLTVYTKEFETKATSSLTAAIAGSVSSLVAITAGVSVAFLIYKRRYQKKSVSGNGEKSFDDGCEMNALSGGNNPIKREPVYEGLKPINERGYVEMKEQTYDILKQKQGSSETKDPIYTNLKL